MYQLIRWILPNEEERFHDFEDENVDPQLRSHFTSACSFLPSVVNGISQEDLLYLYGRYKQATSGPASESERPGIFDIKGRQKFNSWLNLGCMPREEAMQEYISKLMSLDVGFDPFKKYSNAFGIRPSTMAADSDSSEAEEESGMSEETIEWFNAVKVGDLTKIENLLRINKDLLRAKDDNQMAALHWAADRGNEQVVEFLLETGADIKVQDYDGQTPLHYAVSCSHCKTVEVLLERGADPSIADYEGKCALDITNDSTIRKKLESALENF